MQKLAAETTALALADAGLRDLAGMLPEAAARLHGVSGPLPAAAGRRGRTGLVIASAAAGVCEQVREQFGFSADIRYPAAACVSSLHAVVAAAQALQAGDLDLAVAGGAELGIDPAWLMSPWHWPRPKACTSPLTREPARTCWPDPPWASAT